MSQKVNAGKPIVNEIGGKSIIGSPANDEILIFDAVRDAFVYVSGTSGQSNTASNVGTGTGIGVFKQKVGVDLEFKSLSEGNLMNISSQPDNVEIATSAEINTNSKAGTGASLVNAKILSNTPIKSLVAGTRIVVTENTDDVSIATSAELNTGTQLDPVNPNIFKGKTGEALDFRAITEGTGINIVENANDVAISSTVVNTNILVQSMESILIQDGLFITFGGNPTFSAPRTRREIPIHKAGNLTAFGVFVQSNTTLGTQAEMEVLVNGNATGLKISFPRQTAPTSTGFFQDVTNSFPVAVGDVITVEGFKATNGEIAINGMVLSFT